MEDQRKGCLQQARLHTAAVQCLGFDAARPHQGGSNAPKTLEEVYPFPLGASDMCTGPLLSNYIFILDFLSLDPIF